MSTPRKRKSDVLTPNSPSTLIKHSNKHKFAFEPSPKTKRRHSKRIRTESESLAPDNLDDYTYQASICSHIKPAPFSHDPAAVIECSNTDYTQTITKEMALSNTAPRKIRVYADGVYDLFHVGHCRQLLQAKNIFPNVYLIVGVTSDETTHRLKGKTVMSESDRYEAVRHCRYVDEVLPNAPWVIDAPFLRNHKIDFVAHDDIPYTSAGCEDVYKDIKAWGKFQATKRTKGISTSDIVAQIVKDYDVYARRNLARGYTAKQLNVGFLKEKKYQFQNKYDSVKDKGKAIVNKFEAKRTELLNVWDAKSREFISNFLDLFGKDGAITSLWQESKGKLRQLALPPALNNGYKSLRDLQNINSFDNYSNANSNNPNDFNSDNNSNDSNISSTDTTENLVYRQNGNIPLLCSPSSDPEHVIHYLKHKQLRREQQSLDYSNLFDKGMHSGMGKILPLSVVKVPKSKKRINKRAVNQKFVPVMTSKSLSQLSELEKNGRFSDNEGILDSATLLPWQRTYEKNGDDQTTLPPFNVNQEKNDDRFGPPGAIERHLYSPTEVVF